MNIIANLTPQINPIFKSSKTHSSAKTDAVDTVRFTKSGNTHNESLEKVLNLVKCGISDEPLDKTLFENLSYNDWARTYNISQENGLSGIVCDALAKNPDITMPDAVRSAFTVSKDFAERNHSAQESVLKFFSSMTDQFNIDTIQMKGIGLSMNYPNPTHRFGGDIDICNFKRGKGFNEKTQKKTSLSVDLLAKNIGMKVDAHGQKHSAINCKGVPIENHRTFLNLEDGDFAKKMNKYLLDHINPREQVLPKGTKILVPSPEFNTVFLGYHAMKHYIGGDSNAHQLTDWAVHIKKHGLNIPQEVKGTPFEKFLFALTNLSNKYLGTNIEVPENKTLENSILEQFINSPKRQSPKSNSVKNIFLFKYHNLVEREKRAKEFLGRGSTIRGLYSSLKAHASIKKMVQALTKA